MKHGVRLFSVLATVVMMLALPLAAQDTQQTAPKRDTTVQETRSTTTTTEATKVTSGQKMEIEGVIVRRAADSMTVRDTRGQDFTVTLGNQTEVKEKKSNPFRRSRNYATTQLLRGLSIEVEGRGDGSGTLVAEKIKIKDDDLRVATSIESRVTPVEGRLTESETRLGQAETNAQRLSGQVEELSAISNAARGGAKAAQETADAAKMRAEEAHTGVRTTNERITSLDDYDVKTSTMVNFKVGSAVLSPEAKTKLDEIAAQAIQDKAYVIEITGFASADGSEAFNRRLSQRRADAVIQYLAENHNIPLRRLVTPFGYGEKQPVADNTTREGRIQNRRVEVKILTNRGLTAVAGSTSTPTPESR